MIRPRAESPTPLEEFAADFGEEDGYLDFARMGAVGESVVAEERMMGEFGIRARFGSLELAAEQDERVRQAVAGATGFRSDQVVFQPDTGTGLMHAMFGLEGTVALSAGEHPSMLVAVERAGAALGRLEPLWLEAEYGRIMPGTLRDLPAEVTAVAVSHVDHRTGYRADLEGIRQVIGERLLIVDAEQGFGAADAPWELADVIACTGHTWVRAGRGTGFLILSDRAVERLEPVLSGWVDEPEQAPTAPADSAVLLPEAPREARAFAISPPRPAAQARLATALDRMLAVGIETIEAAIAERVDAVLETVDEFALTVASPRANDERAGIVVIEPPAERLTQLAAALYNQGVSATTLAGSIRLSPHVSTSDATVALLRTALAEFAAGAPA